MWRKCITSFFWILHTKNDDPIISPGSFDRGELTTLRHQDTWPFVVEDICKHFLRNIWFLFSGCQVYFWYANDNNVILVWLFAWCQEGSEPFPKQTVAKITDNYHIANVFNTTDIQDAMLKSSWNVQNTWSENNTYLCLGLFIFFFSIKKLITRRMYTHVSAYYSYYRHVSCEYSYL